MSLGKKQATPGSGPPVNHRPYQNGRKRLDPGPGRLQPSALPHPNKPRSTKYVLEPRNLLLRVLGSDGVSVSTAGYKDEPDTFRVHLAMLLYLQYYAK